jgi:hypothetical protein
MQQHPMRTPRNYSPGSTMLPSPKRTNCFKPLVGCVLGPLLTLGTLLLCVVLCLALFSARGPEPPLGDFEPDPTAAAQYERQVLNDLSAAAASRDGLFTVQIEQKALSSWLNTEYDTLFEEYDITRPVIWDYSTPEFQVQFADGQIYFFVGNNIPVVNTNFLITARAFPPTTAFTTALIEVEVISIETGGFQLEEDSATIGARLSELITDQIIAYKQQANIESITVTTVTAANGVLTISGTIN